MTYDTCIVGAGPAGLFAAIIVAKQGGRVIVLEHNHALCQKLLVTGGGRCNLTHNASTNDFVKAFGTFARFLKHSLYEFTADDLVAYFNDQGVETIIQPNNCIFPASQRAGDIANAMINHAHQLGVKIICNTKVDTITKPLDTFIIETTKEDIKSQSMIIATGGISWPHTGSTGDGYQFAKAFGHEIITPKAALVSLQIAQTWLGNISGVSLENVTIRSRANKTKINCSGPLVFTSKGISGPVTLDLSRHLADLLPNKDNPIPITIDLLPEYEISQLENDIMTLCQKHPKKDLSSILSNFLPKSLATDICHQIDPNEQILANGLKKTQRKQLINMLKQLPISITATDSIKGATITRGGISTKQINPRTMQSNLCEGLFFAGETINVDGPCGGYNLQIAFSTAHLAASNCLKT